MDSGVIIGVALLTLAILAVLLARKPELLREFLRAGLKGGPEYLPYRTRGFLLSKGENAFFGHLQQAAEGRHVISMKVRLSDVLDCPKHPERQKLFNRISAKHLDFILCDPRTTRILAAIELDDRSHGRRRRQERDEFVDRALEAAGIPLIRFQASSRYDSRAIAARLEEALGGTEEASSPNA